MTGNELLYTLCIWKNSKYIKLEKDIAVKINNEYFQNITLEISQDSDIIENGTIVLIPIISENVTEWFPLCNPFTFENATKLHNRKVVVTIWENGTKTVLTGKVQMHTKGSTLIGTMVVPNDTIISVLY